MLIPWDAPEKNLALQCMQTTKTTIILYLQLTKSYAFCPSCGSQSKHLHSHYNRFLLDLSSGLQHIALHLKSRKWFCDESFCTQRIFTERLAWVKPYARRTERLQQLLRNIAFSMSCRQAEKVIRPFLPFISHDTFLRLIRCTPIELPSTVAIGLDDFAFRKGIRYGTLICDLISHQPIAILPERTSKVVENWLKQHPNIQTVSRDGSKTYREAISKANPKIQQISDRWHLLKNAKEALENWLEQYIPAQIEWHKPTDEQQQITPVEKPIDESKWKIIQQVQQDYKTGLHITTLAKKYQLSRGTIYNYLKKLTPPLKIKRKSKPAQLKLQPYYESILLYDEQRLTTNQIVVKLRAEGYNGSYSAVRKFLEVHRAQKRKHFIQTLECRISRTQVLSFIWNGFASLNEEKQPLLKRCINTFPGLVQAEKIIQDYRKLFQTKDVNRLLEWMNEQLSNKLSPLYNHSMGIRKDLVAVKNALISPYSNGLLEGQVNRLKWIKRMMYGRAQPDLLEKRMQYRYE